MYTVSSKAFHQAHCHSGCSSESWPWAKLSAISQLTENELAANFHNQVTFYLIFQANMQTKKLT